ncbi:MAG: NAD-dependent epimerase/dehydratase family protein [Thermoguttaceae bacterium]|jgi:threonine 3-dehydrogenase
MNRTCLVTGGAGNLACQLTHRLAERGEKSVLFDLAEKPVAAVAAGCTYVRGDLARPGEVERLLAEHRPDVIIHFASLLSGSSEANRPLAWTVNMDGTFALFEAALAHGVRQVFFPSSVAAYGGNLPDPVPEDFPQWPGGLYGVTKMAVERLGAYYHARHGLDFRAIRVPVVISPFAPPGAASAYASRAFVEALREGRFVFKVRPQTCPSLIYVKDVLRAIVMLMDAPNERLTRRVYNIQALSPTAEEIAEAICRRLPGARMTFEPDPEVVALIEGWPIHFVDASARRDWGWHAEYDLQALADDILENGGTS